SFLTRDWQIREATLFAGRLFKRLMYYTCDRPEKFLPEVTEALTAFEDGMIAESGTVEATAEALFAAKHDALALDFLTRYSHERAMDALRLGEALLESIEVRTRLLFGLREPTGDEMSLLDYTMITCQMRER
ncbi:MAG TPA: peptidase U34, partial [Vicinamibacteria bacterium]|nr:peptidase U34 [Vicinamibacteria bacterium]